MNYLNRKKKRHVKKKEKKRKIVDFIIKHNLLCNIFRFYKNFYKLRAGIKFETAHLGRVIKYHNRFTIFMYKDKEPCRRKLIIIYFYILKML